jgi:class 3 adenylate cyclase
VNPDAARFCLACGVRLAEGGSDEVRRLVTVLFADLVGSTALGESLDPESLRQVMNRYFSAVEAVISRHDGMVEKFIGDAVVAVFGAGRIREDDALRAVRAAAELRQAVASLDASIREFWREVKLQVRTALNTGEVVIGPARAGGSFATGDVVNVAARLQQAADPDEVLLGAPTYRLVRRAVRAAPVEPLAVKGKAPQSRHTGWRRCSPRPRRPRSTSSAAAPGNCVD